MLGRKGDANAARAAYKKALDLRQDHAEAWNNLGTLDHSRGKHKQRSRPTGGRSS